MQAATFSSSFFLILWLAFGGTTAHHLQPPHPLFCITSTLCMSSITTFSRTFSEVFLILTASSIFHILCPVYALSPPLHMSKPSPLALLTLSPKCLAGTVPLTYCDTKSVPPGHSQTFSSSSTSSL